MSARPTRYDDLIEIARRLQRLERKSHAAMNARAELSPGGTRARVTTANARWANAAEARDRALEDLRAEIVRLGSVSRRTIGKSDRGLILAAGSVNCLS